MNCGHRILNDFLQDNTAQELSNLFYHHEKTQPHLLKKYRLKTPLLQNPARIQRAISNACEKGIRLRGPLHDLAY